MFSLALTRPRQLVFETPQVKQAIFTLVRLGAGRVPCQRGHQETFGVTVGYMYGHSGTSSGACNGAITPIVQLRTGYCTSAIKARISYKQQKVYQYHRERPEKVFNIHLVDKTGEIQAALFNAGVDKFFDAISFGEVYIIRNFTVHVPMTKWSSLRNDQEITFTAETTVERCLEGTDSIPTGWENTTPIKSVHQVKTGEVVDVIGICRSVGDVIRSNITATRRHLLLVDQSQSLIKLTLWNSEAEEFDGGGEHPVVAVKGVQVTEYCGQKGLSKLKCSLIVVNPNTKIAHEMRTWFSGITEEHQFDRGFGDGKWLTLREAKSLCWNETVRFNCCATVMTIDTEKSVYKACLICWKKVTEMTDGVYTCKDGHRNYKNFQYKYMLPVYIADHTGEQRVTLFDAPCEELLHVKASVVGPLQEESNAMYARIFDKARLKPFQFKLQTKVVEYNNVERVEMIATTVMELDHKEKCKRLIKEINDVIRPQME